MRYASGAKAWATCQRCGLRGKYVEMVADGNVPNLRVHAYCRDIKNPQEKPIRADDATQLRHPAPDLDDDSPGDSGDTLTEAMGWTRMMGGQE